MFQFHDFFFHLLILPQSYDFLTALPTIPNPPTLHPTVASAKNAIAPPENAAAANPSSSPFPNPLNLVSLLSSFPHCPH
jgi:hypothetical protein